MADQKCSKVHISAVIPPIMIIFLAFLIYQRTRSLNLIFYQILEFNMVAKIQDGCQKVTEFYKVVIELLVQEFFTWNIDLYLLLRSAVYIPSLVQRHNPVWRLRSKMATQNYNIHLLGRYPEISFLPHYAYSCWSTLASCLSQSKFQDWRLLLLLWNKLPCYI